MLDFKVITGDVVNVVDGSLYAFVIASSTLATGYLFCADLHSVHQFRKKNLR